MPLNIVSATLPNKQHKKRVGEPAAKGSDSCVLSSVGSSFHQCRTRTEKGLDRDERVQGDLWMTGQPNVQRKRKHNGQVGVWDLTLAWACRPAHAFWSGFKQQPGAIIVVWTLGGWAPGGQQHSGLPSEVQWQTQGLQQRGSCWTPGGRWAPGQPPQPTNR